MNEPIEPRDAAFVIMVAVGAGVGAAFAGGSPTGGRATDAIVTFLFGALVSWAAASAPWWLLACAGAVAVVFSGPSLWTIPAMATVVIALLVGWLRRNLFWLRSIAGGSLVVGLLHLRIDAFFGASAVVAAAVALMIVAIGVALRDAFVRRWTMWIGLAALAFVLIATAGLAVAAWQSRGKIEAGYDHLQDGLAQLRDGDTALAADTLAGAAQEMRSAGGKLDAFWTKPAALVPVIAQHRTALTDIVDAAAASAGAVAAALESADIDSLRIIDGSLDVEALAELAGPLSDLDRAVEAMARTLRDSDSGWLAGSVQEGLATASREIDRALVQSRASAAAATNGPAMLGIDEPRRYLVVFTSPGEARGQSGLIGNWAEITITDGTIEQTGFGRTAQLVGGIARSDGVVLNASDEFFQRYGPFGAGGVDKEVTGKFWSNVTMTPDAPTAASIMAQMYQGGGFGTVDGVFILDPTGLASLLKVAGAITVEGVDEPITAATLERFLLFDQYKLDEFQRRDVLEAVAGVTLNQFLTASLPAPQELAAQLGPAATEGHIVAWASRPEEEELFRLVGMAGRLPSPAIDSPADGSPGDGSPSDGLAIVTNNASGNKIDSFLHRQIGYEATYNPTNGAVEAQLVITLLNSAPSTGYPDYVIGNIIDLPTGTNRTLLTVYTPLGVRGVTLDDDAVGVTSGTELGWNTATLSLDLAPGEQRTIRIELAGTVSADRYQFIWRPQPLALADLLTMRVLTTAGEAEAGYEGVLARLSIIDRDEVRALR